MCSREERLSVNILHLSKFVEGGAGLGAHRLHESLVRDGVESRILCSAVPEGVCRDRIGTVSLRKRDVFRRKIDSALQRAGIRKSPFLQGLATSKDVRRLFNVIYSSVFTPYRVETHSWVRQSDIVHLHWTCGLLDVSTFFRHCRKPIVWTLRDEWPLLGGFHFRASVPDNMPSEIAENDKNQFRTKRTAFAQHRKLAFIALSEESAAFARSELDGLKHRVFVIPNPASEITLAARPDRDAARAALGIGKEKILLLFISQRHGEIRKGFTFILEAVRRLCEENHNIVLAAIGNPDSQMPVPEGTLLPGFISRQEELLLWYHAADLFASPSLAEGCCKTLLDAQVCGVPSVAFPHPGAKEAIGQIGGIVTEEFSSDALTEALRKALDSKWDRNAIRTHAIDYFSPARIVEKHIALYQSMLEEPTE